MKPSLTIVALLTSVLVFAQRNNSVNVSDVIGMDALFKPNYPEGIYKSKKDFINKKPSAFKKVELKRLKKSASDATMHTGYFYYAGKNKKVKNVFAISYEQCLYFQLEAILKNSNKSDRAQRTNSRNAFVSIITGGENYLYTEAELVNRWAKRAAAGTGASLAPAGGVVAGSLIRFKRKGIVWDFKNKEFNIFKSCKDYNEFIADKVPNAVQECNKRQPDMFEVRKAIEKIK